MKKLFEIETKEERKNMPTIINAPPRLSTYPSPVRDTLMPPDRGILDIIMPADTGVPDIIMPSDTGIPDIIFATW